MPLSPERVKSGTADVLEGHLPPGSKTPSPCLTWIEAVLDHAVGHHHDACRYACLSALTEFPTCSGLTLT
jgi:hypothetical protein